LLRVSDYVDEGSVVMTRIGSFCAAALVSCAFASVLPVPASAQEDKLYVNCQYGFAVIFPAQPMMREINYTTHTGAAVPARQFYNERSADRFTVTVVHYPNGPVVDDQIVEHAAATLRRRGEVRFQAEANYDPGMPGRQLNIFEPNGRQHRASVYMAGGYLTITEANAAPGDFNALQFEQSITLVDSMGVDRERNAGQENRRFDCPR
jgi:hypothetical protein